MIFVILQNIQCLECGLSGGQNQDDLQRSASICMLKVAKTDMVMENTSLEQNYDTSYEDDTGSSIEESTGMFKSGLKVKVFFVSVGFVDFELTGLSKKIEVK